MDLHALLETTLDGLGYMLVDLELPGRSGMLRVFIDKPEKAGGVDIDDCEAVSWHLTRLLEVENVDYGRLEVSSPGLDRPLRKAADFERFLGERVRLRLRRPLGGQRNFHGDLAGFAGGKVTLRLLPDETNEMVGDVEVDLDEIEKARLAPDFGRKPGKPRGKPGQRR
ncbi:MAG: ribosome maturation factor RimP [Zoogloeaceae bacterium]|nr:ribosome maturation factor RimP [Zoogloeaceae bacterium]